LIISAVLFLTITTAQAFAAKIANSKSLMADCGSMLVDTISYCGNLMAECTVEKRSKQRRELAMTLVSLLLLAGFTANFFLEAVQSIEGKEEEDDVNAWIVIGFALGGLLFDVFTLYAYKHFSHSHAGSHADNKSNTNTNTNNVNMMSALLHVFSDLLRSTTCLVEGLLLLKFPDTPGAYIDGWATLIICSLISIGCLSAFFFWLKEMRKFLGSWKGNLALAGFDFNPESGVPHTRGTYDAESEAHNSNTGEMYTNGKPPRRDKKMKKDRKDRKGGEGLKQPLISVGVATDTPMNNNSNSNSNNNNNNNNKNIPPPPPIDTNNNHINNIVRAESPHLIGRVTGGMKFKVDINTPVVLHHANIRGRRMEAEGRGEPDAVAEPALKSALRQKKRPSAEEVERVSI